VVTYVLVDLRRYDASDLLKPASMQLFACSNESWQIWGDQRTCRKRSEKI